MPVRVIESDRCHRKSAKAPLGLLAKPLDGLSFEHRSVLRARFVIDRSTGRDSGRRRLSLPGFSIPWTAAAFVPRRLDRIGPTGSGSFRRDRASAIAEFVHHRSPQEFTGKTFPVKGRRGAGFDPAADADPTTYSASTTFEPTTDLNQPVGGLAVLIANCAAKARL
jgi:hypothetical protein